MYVILYGMDSDYLLSYILSEERIGLSIIFPLFRYLSISRPFIEGYGSSPSVNISQQVTPNDHCKTTVTIMITKYHCCTNNIRLCSEHSVD